MTAAKKKMKTPRLEEVEVMVRRPGQAVPRTSSGVFSRGGPHDYGDGVTVPASAITKDWGLPLLRGRSADSSKEGLGLGA